MRREIFSFSLEGIDVLTKELDRFTEELDERIEQKLTLLAEQVIHDGKRLTGLDSGDLEGSLIVGDVKRTSEGISIEIGNSPETDDYAVAQHEGYRRTKDGRIIYFSPGEKTVSKGTHKGYPAGKKYLENALKINEKLIIDELSKVLGKG